MPHRRPQFLATLITPVLYDAAWPQCDDSATNISRQQEASCGKLGLAATATPHSPQRALRSLVVRDIILDSVQGVVSFRPHPLNKRPA